MFVMKTSLNTGATAPIKIDSRRSRIAHEVDPIAPARHNAQPRRRNVAAVAGGLLLSAGLLFALVPRSNATPEPKPNRDQATTCEPSTETQKFTFHVGEGVNDAVFAIEGSGKGEGDPCWSEAKDAVVKAVGGYDPKVGQQIVEPKSFHPVSPHDPTKQ